jgi:hypothetical protein
MIVKPSSMAAGFYGQRLEAYSLGAGASGKNRLTENLILLQLPAYSTN